MNAQKLEAKLKAGLGPLAVLGALFGVGFFLNGMGDGETIMAQIYHGVYIIGGALVFGLAVLVLAVVLRD